MKEFAPNWISAPGHTLLDIIDERMISFKDFSDTIGMGETFAYGLLLGNEEIDYTVARKLSEKYGPDMDFWTNREYHYRNHPSIENKKKMYVYNLLQARLMFSRTDLSGIYCIDHSTGSVEYVLNYEQAKSFYEPVTDETEIKELTESFNDWFSNLLFKLDTATYREVFRRCRKQLKNQFFRLRPVYTSKELKDAKEKSGFDVI